MKPKRREFVAAAALAACGCVIGCRSGSPDVADSSGAERLPPDANPDGTVDVGTLADYPNEGVYDKYAASDRILVVRHAGRLYALRSVCTHRDCLLLARGGHLVCPCHGSRFAPDGGVTRGPATRPLLHYAIRQDPTGRLTVDKSNRLGPGPVDLIGNLNPG